jgi:hypothetical protein
MRTQYWRKDLGEAIKRGELTQYNIVISLHNGSHYSDFSRGVNVETRAIIHANASILADNLIEQYLPKEK